MIEIECWRLRTVIIIGMYINYYGYLSHLNVQIDLLKEYARIIKYILSGKKLDCFAQHQSSLRGHW